MLGDFGIMQVGRHFSHSIDDFGRIANTVRHVGRKLDSKIGTGVPLPTNVCDDLLWNRGFFDRNILDEQPQYLLSVFGLCGGSMP